MSHRNKGNGKQPKTNANPRTWRRWRIRHSTREPIVMSSQVHIDPNVDPSTGGGGGQHFNSLGGKPVVDNSG